MATTSALTGPVRWADDREAFVVTGFEEASEVLRGPGWSSDPGRDPNAPEVLKALPPGVLLFMDPPDHTRLRRLVAPAFTPRAVERLRPRVVAVVEAVLAGLFAESSEIDLMEEAAYLIPLAVIAELLDVGVEGAEVFRAETPAMVRMLEFDARPDELELSVAASQELAMFLLPLVTERRRRPGGDFVSGLAAAGLTAEEMVGICVLLLAAGHETTANLIGNGTLALLRHPGQIPHLHADPVRAVEELLRLEGPVKLVGRLAVTDHRLGGHHIKAGDRVVLPIEEIHRDPRRYADPHRLDVTRDPLPHLAFGAGHHFCLGAGLARMEAAEALPRLFTRHPDLRLAAEPHWRDSTAFHSLQSLQVTPC
ncbi:cytochrome P450 [Spirillospora sp. NPDC048911]|uniref:cytochrome P450 n=1 Tax=Spirillospora sp. NPDC048911 TaxID=3364527 RepID=UPI0037156DFD